MRAAVILLVCLSSSMIGGTRAATPPAIQCPAPGRPAGMRLTWVAPRAAVDGLPIAILQFRSPLSVTALRAWYWRHWRRFTGHPILYTVSPWQVIARYRGGCFETVQFATSGFGSHGFIGLSEPTQAAPADSGQGRFPVPPGSHLLLTLTSDDHGKHADTFVALTPNGVDARFYYQHVLPQDGWALQMQRAGGGGYGLVFQKRSTVADLSFTPFTGGRTSVLVALVHH